MTHIEFEDLIDELLREGLDISLFYADDTRWYDLNTGMKSDLKIALVGDRCIYKGRYTEIYGEIDDIHDIRRVGERCLCGRDYMSGSWAEFLGAQH